MFVKKVFFQFVHHVHLYSLHAFTGSIVHGIQYIIKGHTGKHLRQVFSR